MICDSKNYNHNHHHHSREKMYSCREYIEALEEERRKIQVFERELPLCLELVTQAIEVCKQQSSGTTTECLHGQSECDEETSSERPVLEEFIPIKRSSCSDDEENKNNAKSSKKSDWLKSVQLWNHTPDPPTKEDSPRRVLVTEVKRNGGGAFHPFKRDSHSSVANGITTTPPTPARVPGPAASSTADTDSGGGGGGGGAGVGSKKEEKEGQSQRKARRCWSQELHRRFLNSLQQLGGPHAATPKQIRELMKVDGLTNDEVKSHLQQQQNVPLLLSSWRLEGPRISWYSESSHFVHSLPKKYRLHTRRPTHNTNNPQAPQFVVVGGIWVPPPPEYGEVAATGEASSVKTGNGIYAPIAAPPPPPSSERASHSEGGAHSHSSATSSFTRTPKATLAL